MHAKKDQDFDVTINCQLFVALEKELLVGRLHLETGSVGSYSTTVS